MSPSPSLTLGCCDPGAQPPDVAAFLRPVHEASMPAQQLRGEKDGEWTSLRDISASEVRALQTALRGAGFYPQGEINGVFDYRTLSAARLFQEYVRSVEGLADIGAPDGVVGPRTQGHKRRPWLLAMGPRVEHGDDTIKESRIPVFTCDVRGRAHGAQGRGHRPAWAGPDRLAPSRPR